MGYQNASQIVVIQLSYDDKQWPVVGLSIHKIYKNTGSVSAEISPKRKVWRKATAERLNMNYLNYKRHKTV